MSGSHLSKDFFELVKAIGESKSKQEEDRIIVQEVAVLKKKCQEKGVEKVSAMAVARSSAATEQSYCGPCAEKAEGAPDSAALCGDARTRCILRIHQSCRDDCSHQLASKACRLLVCIFDACAGA
jgi:hypothetical protein